MPSPAWMISTACLAVVAAAQVLDTQANSKSTLGHYQSSSEVVRYELPQSKASILTMDAPASDRPAQSQRWVF